MLILYVFPLILMATVTIVVRQMVIYIFPFILVMIIYDPATRINDYIWSRYEMVSNTLIFIK